MPSRADMLCPPAGAFERAAWLDENLPQLLRGIPLATARGGWAGVAQLEGALFPRVPLASQALGGELDPACPACGVETDDGVVERAGELFRVTYRSCGHVSELTEAELRARVRPHAGDA